MSFISDEHLVYPKMVEASDWQLDDATGFYTIDNTELSDRYNLIGAYKLSATDFHIRSNVLASSVYDSTSLTVISPEKYSGFLTFIHDDVVTRTPFYEYEWVYHAGWYKREKDVYDMDTHLEAIPVIAYRYDYSTKEYVSVSDTTFIAPTTKLKTKDPYSGTVILSTDNMSQISFKYTDWNVTNGNYYELTLYSTKVPVNVAAKENYMTESISVADTTINETGEHLPIVTLESPVKYDGQLSLLSQDFKDEYFEYSDWELDNNGGYLLMIERIGVPINALKYNQLNDDYVEIVSLAFTLTDSYILLHTEHPFKGKLVILTGNYDTVNIEKSAWTGTSYEILTTNYPISIYKYDAYNGVYYIYDQGFTRTDSNVTLNSIKSFDGQLFLYKGEITYYDFTSTDWIESDEYAPNYTLEYKTTRQALHAYKKSTDTVHYSVADTTHIVGTSKSKVILRSPFRYDGHIYTIPSDDVAYVNFTEAAWTKLADYEYEITLNNILGSPINTIHTISVSPMETEIDTNTEIIYSGLGSSTITLHAHKPYTGKICYVTQNYEEQDFNRELWAEEDRSSSQYGTSYEWNTHSAHIPLIAYKWSNGNYTYTSIKDSTITKKNAQLKSPFKYQGKSYLINNVTDIFKFRKADWVGNANTGYTLYGAIGCNQIPLTVDNNSDDNEYKVELKSYFRYDGIFELLPDDLDTYTVEEDDFSKGSDGWYSTTVTIEENSHPVTVLKYDTDTKIYSNLADMTLSYSGTTLTIKSKEAFTGKIFCIDTDFGVRTFTADDWVPSNSVPGKYILDVTDEYPLVSYKLENSVYSTLSDLSYGLGYDNQALIANTPFTGKLIYPNYLLDYYSFKKTDWRLLGEDQYKLDTTLYAIPIRTFISYNMDTQYISVYDATLENSEPTLSYYHALYDTTVSTAGNKVLSEITAPNSSVYSGKAITIPYSTPYKTFGLSDWGTNKTITFSGIDTGIVVAEYDASIDRYRIRYDVVISKTDTTTTIKADTIFVGKIYILPSIEVYNFTASDWQNNKLTINTEAIPVNIFNSSGVVVTQPTVILGDGVITLTSTSAFTGSIELMLTAYSSKTFTTNDWTISTSANTSALHLGTDGIPIHTYNSESILVRAYAPVITDPLRQAPLIIYSPFKYDGQVYTLGENFYKYGFAESAWTTTTAGYKLEIPENILNNYEKTPLHVAINKDDQYEEHKIVLADTTIVLRENGTVYLLSPFKYAGTLYFTDIDRTACDFDKDLHYTYTKNFDTSSHVVSVYKCPNDDGVYELCYPNITETSNAIKVEIDSLLPFDGNVLTLKEGL